MNNFFLDLFYLVCMDVLPIRMNVNPMFACCIPWNWVTDGGEPPHRCWELNWIICKSNKCS